MRLLLLPRSRHAPQRRARPARTNWLLHWILGKWAKILHGRLAIYEYDQSLLVWRDLPNTSHIAFARDVKTYRDAGALGFVTKSRNALAITFINICMRGRLM